MLSFRLSFLLQIVLYLCASFAAAESILGTTALETCMTNSSVSATVFDVAYTPNNKTLTFDIEAISTTTGSIVLTVEVYVYGIKALTKVISTLR